MNTRDGEMAPQAGSRLGPVPAASNGEQAGGAVVRYFSPMKIGTRTTCCAALIATSLALAAPSAAWAQMSVTIGGNTISLDGVGYERGNAKAPVWLVEFADFGCGYCEKFSRESFPVLDSAFFRSARAYFRYVPFTTGMFRNSREAAEASICAAEKGKFYPMHDLLYEKRKEWMAAADARSAMARYARSVGLDAKRFEKCASGKAVTQQLLRNNELARSLYVRGTPTFFINGETVPGALPTEIFVKGIEGVIKAVGGK